MQMDVRIAAGVLAIIAALMLIAVLYFRTAVLNSWVIRADDNPVAYWSSVAIISVTVLIGAIVAIWL